MPIKIPNGLPAFEILQSENIFVMSEERAYHQDIRPLRIAILNLMPVKIITETHLLRMIGNSPLQVEIVLLHPRSHKSKNTPAEHLQNFYQTFEDVKHMKFDGLIITGAPVEHFQFTDVTYWNELCEIMEWSKTNVFSTLHICWAAVAGLSYHYGVPKKLYDKKIFGVFKHKVNKRFVPLFRGFDDVFYVPHSRYCGVENEDIDQVEELEVLSESDEAGIYVVATKDGRQFFVTGHSEYDSDTLRGEYDRDIKKGVPIEIPANYFKNDNPENDPIVRWRSHGNLFFTNWLNYYVYQQTPYDLDLIK